MAQSILIIAESGSGKSTSIRTLNPKETFIINIASKPLPFKNWQNNYKLYDKTTNPNGNLLNISNPTNIYAAMKHVSEKMPHIKNLIIDDWQYMSSFEYFDRASEKGYDKFTQIAANLAQVAKLPKDLRDDLFIFFLTHSEDTIDVNGKRKIKAKTVGKMIDNSLTLEGLFSIVLFAKVIKNEKNKLEYVFVTQTDGENTCKTPMEMFDNEYIPNDLELVRQTILKYN
jgi:hypothetical protein